MANRCLVQHAVGLCAGCPYRRAFGAIENAKLDACRVGRQRHRTAQRVNLFDQMPFADTADRRVATHLAQGFDVVRQQQRLATHACTRQRRLGASMPAAHNDHIKMLRIKHVFALVNNPF